ncbi:ABC transporter permease [Lentzea sp. NPDC058436]|uniref:ABC transporter permease n=1 Tax=Lentzea sp. NPDC058436 TaxID=3346499 RepID=UPI0036677827
MTTLLNDRVARAVSFAGVVRGEWIKLISVRSSTICLANAAVAMLFAVVMLPVKSMASAVVVDDDPVATVLSGAEFAGLAVGVLGVLMASTEYATGMVRVVLTAVPSRLPVLFAKIVALVALVFPAMLVMSLVAFFGGMAVLDATGGAVIGLADPGALRAVVGAAVSLAGVGVIGIALGTLLRTTAAAVTAVITLVFLMPNLGDLLPQSWRENVLKYLPAKAIDAFVHTVQDPALLSPAAGALVFGAWIVVVVGAAVVRLRGRDV